MPGQVPLIQPPSGLKHQESPPGALAVVARAVGERASNVTVFVSFCRSVPLGTAVFGLETSRSKPDAGNGSSAGCHGVARCAEKKTHMGKGLPVFWGSARSNGRRLRDSCHGDVGRNVTRGTFSARQAVYGAPKRWHRRHSKNGASRRLPLSPAKPCPGSVGGSSAYGSRCPRVPGARGVSIFAWKSASICSAPALQHFLFLMGIGRTVVTGTATLSAWRSLPEQARGMLA